jgi:hypothetical protein
MNVADFLGMLVSAEGELAEAFESVGLRHRNESEVVRNCRLGAVWSRRHVEMAGPLLKRYGQKKKLPPRILHGVLFSGVRRGAVGLLRDLMDLSLMAHQVHGLYSALHKAASALRDEELQTFCDEMGIDTNRQLAWLRSKIGTAAAQTLVAAA